MCALCVISLVSPMFHATFLGGCLCVISLVSPMFHATFLGGCLVRSVLAGWTGLTSPPRSQVAAGLQIDAKIGERDRRHLS